MGSKAERISGYVASWKPNFSGLSDNDITQLRTLVAQVPPVSCRDAGSMLAAGARFLSDQSDTGEMVVWSVGDEMMLVRVMFQKVCIVRYLLV